MGVGGAGGTGDVAGALQGMADLQLQVGVVRQAALGLAVGGEGTERVALLLHAMAVLDPDRP
ncbi:MAG TPA: hypothetical protein PKI77_17190, partial [Mycobacterium sp.]|nr:hypothetical protein [Mycobacterium sp.]